MSKSPAFQFYAAEFLADENVVMMTNQEIGCYIKLMCYCWREGSIPSDVSKIAKLCGEDSSAMAQLWLSVSTCFSLAEAAPDRLVHKRLEKEREKQKSYSLERSASGKKGAEAKRNAASKGSSSATSSASAKHIAIDSSSSSSSSSSSIVKTLLTQPPVAVLSGMESDGFDTFWSTWPQSQRKVGKVSVQAKWKKLRLFSIAKQITDHVKLMKESKQWKDGYEPAPLTYINQRRWEDGNEQSPDDQQFAGVM